MLPLNKEDFCSLVYRPDLKVKREEDVYGAITCWIGHDHKNRSKYKFDVLQQVRLVIVEIHHQGQHIGIDMLQISSWLTTKWCYFRR